MAKAAYVSIQKFLRLPPTLIARTERELVCLGRHALSLSMQDMTPRWLLWFLEVVARVFVCLGILILFDGSGDKLITLAAIVFFGFAVREEPSTGSYPRHPPNFRKMADSDAILA
ncbi:MAG: hypothetical protein J2P54_01230 [Bradyrhizobiaceae bacterium]|nr:hypothetical protein [Bradyrhizobiaceae bacterium]